jgi:hypothetical protein
MSSVSWHQLHGLDHGLLSKARVQAHVATQWLARVALAYVSARPNDSHTNLGWDDRIGGFVTHALPDGARFALRVADLTLLVLNDAGADPSNTLALDGRRDTEARVWLGLLVAARRLDPHALDAPPPYQMPAPASGAVYTAAALADGLRALAMWFSNANAALGATRLDIIKRNLDAPPVRCWPHHFDLDSLVELGPGRTTGIGFSPGDHFYDEPYFYVSLYPAPDVASLPPLPAIGHWHADRFTAAVATASRIGEAKDQYGEVEAFLHAATEATIKALR